ncbi:MAG TPA: protein kinase [Polyangiales bacterium]
MRACTYCHQLLSEGDSVCPRDGAAAREVQLARVPGQLHARFPAIEPFACGATGSSFLAVQSQSGFRGLLKILAPEVAASAAERTRLKRELRKQTTLTNNALARIIDGGEIGNDLWLFRDFVAGESLAVRLRQGPLQVPEALAIAAQVASALDEVHRQGLLHRDIKPGHVLLTPRIDVVPLVTVIDAGVAARLPSDSVFELLGTPAYVAPEVIAGKPASFRSDLYALGCMLHEMLTGAPPFVADTVAAVLALHRDQEPMEVDVEVPAPVRALLGSLLAKEPRRRPFSAQQVRRTLDPYLPATTPEASSGTRTLAGNIAAPRSSEPELGRVTPAPKGAAPSSQPARRSSTPKFPAARGAPPPPVPAGFAKQEQPTQELDLADVVAPSPLTQELDLADVVVPSSLMLMVDEVEVEPPTFSDLESTRLMVTPVRAEPAPTVTDGAPAQLMPPEVVTAPAPSIEAPHAPAPEAASLVEPAQTAAEPSAPAARPAVHFDVESLFDDDLDSAKQPVITSPPPPAARSSAPAVVRRSSVPPPVFAPGAPISAPAAAPLSSSSASPSRSRTPAPPPMAAASASSSESAPPAADPEGTVVMVRKPVPARSNRSKQMFGAAALLLLIAAVVVLRSGGREQPSRSEPASPAARPPTAAVDDSVAPKPAAAPSGAPAASADTAAVAPAPSGAAEAAPVAAAKGAAPAADTAAAQKPASAEPAPADVAPARPGAEASETAAAKAARAGTAPVRYKAPPVAEPGVDYKAKGRELFQAGKYKEAALTYERATQQTPSDAGAFAGLGASCLSSNQPDKAILAYQRAVQLKPDASGFHAALARAYMQKNDRGRAVAAYKKALALDPNNQAAKTALAVLASQ